MAPIVLVHGSFHGGWCWKKIVPPLRDAGHNVITPTMTGLGERFHLVSPQVGLHLNVEDIVNVFEFEDITGVTLVGHSYGGLVITGVAEQCRDRIDNLVYLDGFLPEHGESAWDIFPDGEELWSNRAKETGTEWLIPPPDPAERYNVRDPQDLEWLRLNLKPTTMLTHEEPVVAPNEHAKSLDRSYISCTDYEAFRSTAQKAREEGLDYYEIETGHDAMVTAPAELTNILKTIVA